tara:strand:+ start:666 stop:1499 length:834 start_codon:yes stop_codon:yes gene_type:complete
MIETPHLKRSKEWLRKSLEKIQVLRKNTPLDVRWWIDNNKLPEGKGLNGQLSWSKEHPYKCCSACKLEKHITEYHIRTGRSKRTHKLHIGPICKPCHNLRDRKAAGLPRYVGKPQIKIYIGNADIRGKAIKKVLMDYFGGACTRCGFKGQSCQMDFDHTNPESKEFTLGLSGIPHRSVEEIMDEVEKCKLICSNCHRLVSSHYKTQEEVPTHLDDGVNGVLVRMSSPEPDKPKLRSDSPIRESIFEGAPAGTRYASDGKRPVLVNKTGDKALNSITD